MKKLPYDHCCHHCSISLPAEECGRAEHWGQYIDEDGHECGDPVLLCSECLAAGSPDGPGYRRLDGPEVP